jgi:hypothetical protein
MRQGIFTHEILGIYPRPPTAQVLVGTGIFTLCRRCNRLIASPFLNHAIQHALTLRVLSSAFRIFRGVAARCSRAHRDFSLSRQMALAP